MKRKGEGEREGIRSHYEHFGTWAPYQTEGAQTWGKAPLAATVGTYSWPLGGRASRPVASGKEGASLPLEKTGNVHNWDGTIIQRLT